MKSSGPLLSPPQALLEKMPAGMAGVGAIDGDHRLDVIDAKTGGHRDLHRRMQFIERPQAISTYSSIEPGFGVGVHVGFQQRQQRHLFLLHMHQQALAQLLPKATKLAPLGLVEALRGRVARQHGDA